MGTEAINEKCVSCQEADDIGRPDYYYHRQMGYGTCVTNLTFVKHLRTPFPVGHCICAMQTGVRTGRLESKKLDDINIPNEEPKKFAVPEEEWGVSFYKRDKLPCCLSKTFKIGPRGGENTNIECCGCGERWNVSLDKAAPFIEKI